MRSFFSCLLLMGFYALLSGQFHSAFLMIVGGICCVVVVAFTRHLGTLDSESMPMEYWAKTLAYVPWLLWQILVSNFDVARRVWSLSPGISPTLVQVPHSLQSAYGIATYANSITLTPGTVTVTVGEQQFLIHALTHDAANDLLAGDMHARVHAIEASATPPRS